MQNLSNSSTTSGVTPPVPGVSLSAPRPPGDTRAPEVASILRSLEVGRLLYLLRRRNPGLNGNNRTAEPTAPTPSLPAAQLAVNIAAPLSVRSLGAPVPPPVGHAVRVPFPLPAHPGHLPGVQSSLLPTSDITQTDSSCAASQLLHLIACAISGMEGTAGQGVGPSNGARVAPSPSILPNFLTGNAAAPRGYDAEAILRSRSHQAVGKKQRRKDNKKKSQKNDNHHPPQNSGEVKSKRQKKGSKKNQGPKKNQAGDSSGGKSCERA